MTEKHGYSGYSNGCRCVTCRKAKADYMRERRQEARLLAQKHTTTGTGRRPGWHNAFDVGAVRHVAAIEKHGTRYGYEEAGCRCPRCTAARSASDAKYRK